MASMQMWYSLIVLLVLSYTQSGTGVADDYNLAGQEYVFELKDSLNRTCFYASFQLDFKITYLHYSNVSNQSITDVMSKDIKLPNNTQVMTDGQCDSDEATLSLSWMEDDTEYSTSFMFFLYNNTWNAQQIAFTFNLSLFTNPVGGGIQTYVTNFTNLFSRSFGRSDYFYCEKCKTFTFTNCSEESLGSGNCVDPCPLNGKNVTNCTNTLDMMRSVIYPGDIIDKKPNRKLCIEDYIALQEMIVPIVVGGILAVLLVLIFLAYIIAYIRRRRREGRYERLGDTTY